MRVLTVTGTEDAATALSTAGEIKNLLIFLEIQKASNPLKLRSERGSGELPSSFPDTGHVAQILPLKFHSVSKLDISQYISMK